MLNDEFEKADWLLNRYPIKLHGSNPAPPPIFVF